MEDEIAADRMHYPLDVHMFLNPWVFTKQTGSLIVGWGIYFGEVMRHQHPQLTWDWVQRPKSSADLRQPVLSGFAYGDFLNSIAIMEVVCQKVVDCDANAALELPRLYKVWSSYVTNPL